VRKYSEAWKDKEPYPVGHCWSCHESFTLDSGIGNNIVCPNKDCYYVMEIRANDDFEDSIWLEKKKQNLSINGEAG